MNTLKIEAELAKKYGYKPLPKDISAKYRSLYRENVPKFVAVQGANTPLYTIDGTLLCNNYDRVVIGDYGAFIEFSQPASKFIIKPGQEYRVNDERYAQRVKYIWLTALDTSDIKIYLQKRTVTYADYKPGKYYVSVHEVMQKK